MRLDLAPKPAPIPVLETERLLLRGHRATDLPECARMWGDPEVTRYIGGTPLGEEEVWARLLRYLGHWSLLGFGYWLLEEKATGRFAGEVGLANNRRDVEPSIDGFAELGWVVSPLVRGKGYATEGARAALSWADRSLPGVPTACLINPLNEASINVARKLGYGGRASAMYRGKPTLVFFRDASGQGAGAL